MKLGVGTILLAGCLAAGCESRVNNSIDASAGNTPAIDAGTLDEFGCALPKAGCSGCNAVMLTGSFYAPQIQNCKLTFQTSSAPAEAIELHVVVGCEVRTVPDVDAGVTWLVIPSYDSEARVVTLTLPLDICDLVKNNTGARVDVFAELCGIPIMCGG